MVKTPKTYGAVDLGTNNCRLLIAQPSGEGFRVITSYSRIVRLGEGLLRNERLSASAILGGPAQEGAQHVALELGKWRQGDV